jgi:hypothetical protein
MAFQGLYNILLQNRAKIEATAIPQLRIALGPLAEIIENPDLKELCPSPEALQRLILLKDNTENSIITLQRRTVPLQDALTKIQVALTFIPPIITLLKTFPVPNQFTTSGFVVTLSDRLENLKLFSQKLRGGVISGQYVVTNVNTTLSIALQLLSQIDQAIAICAPDQVQQNEEIARLSQSFNTPITQFNNSYKGYTLELRTINQNTVAPLRYAVAVDKSGVVVLEGRPSYSSSTEVLLNEIKFRIDQLSS